MKTTFLGGTDIGREGGWYWANSLLPVEDFMWHSGTPNCGTDCNCMIIANSYNYEGNDYNCQNKLYPICQKFNVTSFDDQ